MTKTHTITLEVDGQQVNIEVEELTIMEQYQWSAKAPHDLRNLDSNGGPSEDVVNFVFDLIFSQTKLTEGSINSLSQKHVNKLIHCVAAYAFGNQPTGAYAESQNEYKHETNTNIETDENGAVDLDDWQ